MHDNSVTIIIEKLIFAAGFPMKNLDPLINPKSIAIIGASRKKGKLGRIVLNNIVNSGYKGKIYAVNPKANKIGKFKSYHSVTEISGKIDVGVIAIPAKFSKQVIEECVKKKVRAIIIISAGFSETGAEGIRLENELRQMLDEAGIPMLGPNCLGVITTKKNLNITFAKSRIKRGTVAFISQSGALGTAGLDWAEGTGVGFSHFVSIGNKADINENHLIQYFDKDPDISAIALYLEDFADGQSFIEIARKTKKPVIILKPGKTEAAQDALGSHTGALAQSDDIVTAAIRQGGLVRADTIEELFNTIQLFSQDRIMNGNNIAVVTNAGGPGVVTTDALELAGLNITKFNRKTEKILKLKLPEAASSKNPVDVLGDARSDRYDVALKSIIADETVDGIIVLLTPQVMTDIEVIADVIVKASKKTNKLIVTSFIGGKEIKRGTKLLAAKGIPTFRYPSDAVDALANVWEDRQRRAYKRKSGKEIPVKIGNADAVKNMLSGVSGVVDTQTAEKILEVYGISVLKSYFPQDIADARRLAKKLTYPVVLKVIHPELLHKIDAGGVKLNIKDEDNLEKQYTELSSVAEEHNLEDYRIEMQHFVQDALELIVGVKREDDQYMEIEGTRILRKRGFGHSVVFGKGGIYTEIERDFELGVIPLLDKDIQEIVSHTTAGKILQGVRGQKFNIGKVYQTIKSLSLLVQDFPQIAELDINPLFARDDEVWVVDVKMIVQEQNA